MKFQAIFSSSSFTNQFTKQITATHSCRTRKRAVHFCSPGVVRRSHAAARNVRALLYTAAVAAAAAADIALDLLLIKN